jgi:hypothetical protein
MPDFDPDHLDALIADFKEKTATYTEASDANNTAQVAAQAAMGDAAVAMDAVTVADKARDASADELIAYLTSLRDSLRL